MAEARRHDCMLHPNPAECPREHVCGHCGEELAEHLGASAQCSDAAHHFIPDVATLRRFPFQYEPKG